MPRYIDDKIKVNTFTSKSARENGDGLIVSELTIAEVSEKFGVDIKTGLKRRQVKEARKKYGPNNPEKKIPIGFTESIKRQVRGILPIFLIGTLAIYGIFFADFSYIASAVGIVFLMILNAFIEHTAERIFEDVSKIDPPRVIVRRDGKNYSTSSRTLLPGDILVLEPGSVITADARLIECTDFSVIETVFNKTDIPVFKDATYISNSNKMDIYPNMVYAGTYVNTGTAKAIVCATNEDVMINRISESNEHMPKYLETIRKSGHTASLITVCAEILILTASVVFGVALSKTFIISLAVGAAVLCDTAFSLSALIMARGVSKAAKKGAVICDLDKLEKLCELDCMMCDDRIALPQKYVKLDTIYDCRAIMPYSRQTRDRAGSVMRALLICSALTERLVSKKNTGETVTKYEAGAYTMALVKAATEASYDIDAARKSFFTIDVKKDETGEMSAILGFMDDKRCVIVRGSPEDILNRCVSFRVGRQVKPLDKMERATIMKCATRMATTSVPIAVAIGYTDCDTLSEAPIENNLSFIGIAGFFTALRFDAAVSVYQSDSAGIKPSVYSDSPYLKSMNLAMNIGIINGEDEILTGEKLHTLDPGVLYLDNEKYGLLSGLTETELIDVMKTRTGKGHKVGVAIAKSNNLSLVRQSYVSFASSELSFGSVMGGCDVRLNGGLYESVIEAIRQAKAVTKHTVDVCRYIFCSSFMLFFWLLFSIAFYGEVPFSIPGIVLFGMVMNTMFASALAFAPNERKILAENIVPLSGDNIFGGIKISLAYSALASLLCVFSERFTSSEGAPLITYVSLLYMFSLMTGKSRSVFTNRFYRNYLYIVSAIAAAGIIVATQLVPALSEVFGCPVIKLPEAMFALGISAVFFLVIETVMFYQDRKDRISFKNKKKGKRR